MQFYAFLCEQMLGKRPVKVQLLYLHEPMAIVSSPTEQSLRGLTMRTSAIWTAVEKACARDDFRPKPSGLCNYCSYKVWCPAYGGDPSQAPSRRFEHLPEDTALIAGLNGPLPGLNGPSASLNDPPGDSVIDLRTPSPLPLTSAEALADTLLDAQPVASA